MVFSRSENSRIKRTFDDGIYRLKLPLTWIKSDLFNQDYAERHAFKNIYAIC